MSRPGGTCNSLPDSTALEVSVVIPCLNEALTLAGCVMKARTAMAEQGIDGEVLVVDNGSEDDSVSVATAAGARVISCPVKGYGAALQWGFLHALGRYVIMGDADQSYDFSLIPRFLEKARQHAPFVIGSRLRGRIEPGAMPRLHRYVGTPVLTWILNRFFETRISDCNCGMRCLDRETFLKLGISSTGMEFASEMILKAAVKGVKITEIPIDFYRDRRNRRPHLRSFRDGWRHLRLLLWHAPDHVMTLPGICLLAIGLSLVLSQLAGPISIGRTTLDIHYMILGVTLSLIGTSATTLGLAVGSTTPGGHMRHVRALAAAHRWFSFDNAIRMAVLLLVGGVLADGVVLSYWLYYSQPELTLAFTRLTLFGLLLIAMSVQIAFSALLLGSTTVARTSSATEGDPLAAALASRARAAAMPG